MGLASATVLAAGAGAGGKGRAQHSATRARRGGRRHHRSDDDLKALARAILPRVERHVSAVALLHQVPGCRTVWAVRGGATRGGEQSWPVAAFVAVDLFVQQATANPSRLPLR